MHRITRFLPINRIHIRLLKAICISVNLVYWVGQSQILPSSDPIWTYMMPCHPASALSTYSSDLSLNKQKGTSAGGTLLYNRLNDLRVLITCLLPQHSDFIKMIYLRRGTLAHWWPVSFNQDCQSAQTTVQTGRALRSGMAEIKARTSTPELLAD